MSRHVHSDPTPREGPPKEEKTPRVFHESFLYNHMCFTCICVMIPYLMVSLNFHFCDSQVGVRKTIQEIK